MIELLITLTFLVLAYYIIKAVIKALRPAQTQPSANAQPQTTSLPANAVLQDYYAATQETLIIADVETTGLSKDDDEIIEIAAVKYEGGDRIQTFSQLVKPSVKITAKITEITGITNVMVASAPPIETVLPEFRSFVGDGATLLCHNAAFDKGFILSAARQIDLPFNLKFIDSLPIAGKAFPRARSHKLGRLADDLNIDTGDAHRALDDCSTLMFVYLACQQVIAENSQRLTVTDVGDKLGGYSGISVNKALIAQGFQDRERDSDGKWVYIPSEKATAHIIKGEDYFHWKESIIAELDMQSYKKKKST